LARSARGHTGEVDRVLTCAEVLGLIRLDLQPRRLLELDVRILRVELPVDAVLEHPERAAEDHRVALAHEARDDLRRLGVREDVLLVGRLDLVPEGLLYEQAPAFVRLRPAAVVVRPWVHERDLEGRLPGLRRPRRREHEPHGEEREHEPRSDHPPSHLLLLSCLPTDRPTIRQGATNYAALDGRAATTSRGRAGRRAGGPRRARREGP